MKRFLLQILACMMILLACTESTLAYNNTFDLYNPLEIGPHCGLDANNDSQLDNSTILDIINQMILENINTYNPSKNELEQAYRIINMYDNIIIKSKCPTDSRRYETMENTRGSGDDNWMKLRYGNLIEVTLDYSEGITNAQVLTTIAQSRTAETDAANNFPLYNDSAKHFIWNFMMTAYYNQTKARTIANNHEWGIAMISPMLNHFELAYENYINAGFSPHDASSRALADTIVYIPIFKYDAVCIMEQSYAFFKAFFTDDSFMDFWNNCYGRSYPSKGYISGISAFSYSAFTAHELVLDGAVTLTDNLTEAHRYSIWSWDWYSY